MNILLIDNDGKLPNLALMKLSQWHKEQGDKVFLGQHGHPDKVYISTLFTWCRPAVEALLKVYPSASVGGTGWDLTYNLLPEIEAMKPDYDLYKVGDILHRIRGGISKKESKIKKAETIINAGIGFTSRGCIRNCGFCFVPPKEGKFRQVAEIKDLLNPKSNVLILLDNNLTADPDVIEKLKEIKERDLIVDITQGIDVRLMTPEIALALSEVKLLRSLHYAWDLFNSRTQVLEGIKILSQYIKPYKHMCFLLVGYNTCFEQDMYRYRVISSKGISPYVMIYNNKAEPKLHHFARWVNGRICKICSFEEYEPWVKSQGIAGQMTFL